MEQKKIIPVILSGGLGSRLWPLSRSSFPKQLQSLVSEKSLLQETIIRASGPFFDDPLIICNKEHRFIIGEQLQEIGIKPKSIVLEPEGRNTAPAVAASALMLEQEAENPMILVLPSDHTIQDPVGFSSIIALAQQAAIQNRITTLGVPVTRAETGYGYIKRGSELAKASGCFQLERFIEKPDQQMADLLSKTGEYLWNSGIFLFYSSIYLEELNRHHPEIIESCRAAVKNKEKDLDFIRLGAKDFASNPSISLDYAVMESTTNGAVVEANIGWNDLGSWDALWESSIKDPHGNVIYGDIVINNVEDSYLRSDKNCVAAIGIKDTIVIATDDAILIANRENAQNVRELVDQLKERPDQLYATHTKIFRPWGWYHSLEKGAGFQVKRLHLKKHAKISLQRHRHRTEHWVVVEGLAEVTRGKETFKLKKNQSTFIPAGEKHRLANIGDGPLEIIEIQSGEYLGEDDIERFEDQYGRS
ncbi:MAG: mannose-1-phosphate guanylyltransferase/mannose-6-phosphate isomerase [Pseudomonadota bacterium]|nr:mannose-1-phosphate guanylyltransferase/mannose-6-phosphate isomerase [Pseudomonadota bacterium]